MFAADAMTDELSRSLGDITSLMREAGEAIMNIYANAFDVTIKADKSPVTKADTRSSDIVTEGLSALFPNVPVLCEETQDIGYAVRRNWDYYWLLDPLDGTREFIKRNDEFCINLALMRRHQPVAGFIFQPVAKTLHYAIGSDGVNVVDANNAVRIVGSPKVTKARRITVVASRSHAHPSERKTIEALQQAGYELHFMSMGSAIKFCLMAEGAVDIYLRYGPTSEWDTAAGHAMLNAIGGTVIDTKNRRPLLYNKEQLLNPSFAALAPSVQQLADYVL